MAIQYRLGIEEDAPVTYQVFAEANRELNSRRGLPDMIADDPPADLPGPVHMPGPVHVNVRPT